MRFKRSEAFRSEIVKLTLRFIPRDITRNVYYTQPVDLEDLEAKFR